MLITIVLYAFCLVWRRYMKGAFTIKYMNTSIICSQNGNVDSVKALTHSNAFFMKKMTKMFEEKGYKWGYIRRSLRKL